MGTRMVGSTARTSIWEFMRRSVTAAPGLALRRRYATARRLNASSALGARLEMSISPPHAASISSISAARASGVGAHG